MQPPSLGRREDHSQDPSPRHHPAVARLCPSDLLDSPIRDLTSRLVLILRERDDPAQAAPVDLAWMMWAECAELTVKEADRFSSAGQGQSRLANQARAICAVCQAQPDCLEFALRHPEETEYGVWGGTSPGERRRPRGLSR
jgi:hypothetical protein